MMHMYVIPRTFLGPQPPPPPPPSAAYEAHVRPTPHSPRSARPLSSIFRANKPIPTAAATAAITTSRKPNGGPPLLLPRVAETTDDSPAADGEVGAMQGAASPSELSPLELERLPTCPPNSATPVYAFAARGVDVRDTSSLCLFCRLAVPTAGWSHALTVHAKEPQHFFAGEEAAGGGGGDGDGGGGGGGDSDALPAIVRVSMHEQGSTIFMVCEDASDAPPCQVLNLSERALWFAMHRRSDGANSKLQWHELIPGPGADGRATLLWASDKDEELRVVVSSRSPRVAGLETWGSTCTADLGSNSSLAHFRWAVGL